LIGFPSQRTHGYQQQQRVQERCEDRGTLAAVGMARIGSQATRQHKAEHVTQVSSD
jgi:hypothetical protein